MGERDPGLAPAPPRKPPWAARAVLALALAGLLGLVLIAGPPAPAEAPAGPLVGRLLAAPLAWAAPVRGEAILGVLALAVAAAAAGAVLERRLGGAAWLLLLLLIFGSAAWALVWSSGARLVTLALAVTAFALARARGPAVDETPGEIYRPEEIAGGGVGRWLAVGLLLGALVISSPVAAVLLLPAALAVPPGDRRRGLALLIGGWLAAAAVEAAVAGPAVVAQELAAAAESLRFDAALAGWNLGYLAAGRNVGLLVGFAPALLLLWLGRGGGRRALPAACLAAAAAAALLLPFDFASGWLGLLWLPLYGALWLLPARLPRAAEWLAVLVLSGLATWALWAPPWAAAAAGGSVAAASWPRRWLPYETTLRDLPGGTARQLGSTEVHARTVRGCRFLGEPGRFELSGGEPAELWLAAPPELDMVALEFGPGAPSSLIVRGAESGRTVFRPDGRVGFELRLVRPRARHPLWFADQRFAVHLITIDRPGGEGGAPLRFRLLAPQPG